MIRRIPKFRACLPGIVLLFTLALRPLLAADPGPQSSVRVRLTRSSERKLSLQAAVPGGSAWFELDTGAPITCADETEAALFKFQSKGTMAASMLMNGQNAKMVMIPQMEMGGLVVKNVPAALVDLASINRSHERNYDHQIDAILGLDALFRLHAVINFDSGKMFLQSASTHEAAPAGWSAVPMRLVGGHLIIPVTLNGVQTFFMVDTGAPSSIIDSALCQNQHIPVGAPAVGMKAINHELKAAIGNISDFRIGSVDLGQTRVAVFDLNALAGKGASIALPFTGFIGAQTLERLRAIIDCNSMQLYIRQPRRGWWIF